VIGVTGESTDHKTQKSWIENNNMTECTQKIGDILSITFRKTAAKSLYSSIFLDDEIVH
jgi:hypothetical protein